MSKTLLIRGATLKHINGDSYPATNVVTAQEFSILPIGFVVPDNDYLNIYSILSDAGNVVDAEGNFTSSYYAVKNLISDFFNLPLFAMWGQLDNYSAKIVQAFMNYNVITAYASGSYNNAVIVKGDYELYCVVPSMGCIKGTYKNGVMLDMWAGYSGIVGYANRAEIFVYNESLTSSFGITANGAFDADNRVQLILTTANTGIPAAIKNALLDIAEQGDLPTDPYDPGGQSGTGGGTGTFGGTGDDIDIPPLPTLSAVDTGFITLFNPSAAQLKNLANYMWSSGFDLDTFKKIFADPMDCVLGLSIVPVNVPNGGGSTVSIGNISTGVSMTKAASQYVSVDCGSLNVEEFWGAYLDYDPYTKAEIYLPYIGTHPISVDDIMGKNVHVVYHVDVLSGACIAYVKCGDSVLYSFIGQCSSSIPITGNDWTNVINGVLSIAGAVGTMVATGGLSAPIAAATIASTAVNSMKPSVEKSGSLSGTGGMLGIQTPYLILTRPQQALPANQNSFLGYPSFITENLSDISGYTEIESVHLVGIGATEHELSEIENLLKSGVIF